MNQDLIQHFTSHDSKNYEYLVQRNCYGVHPPDFLDAYVLDIGANIGIFSHMALDMGAKWVFSVEPNPAAFEVLAARATNKMTLLKAAVAGKCEMGRLSVSSASDASCLSENGEHEVPIITLHSLLSLIPQGAKIAVKIDNEGSEYDTLYSASWADLERISMLTVEFHDSQRETLQAYVPHVKKHPLHTEAYLLQYMIKMGMASVWALNFFEIINGVSTPSPISIRKFVRQPQEKSSTKSPFF